MNYFLRIYAISHFFLQSDPELAQAVLGSDLNKLQDILRERNKQRSEYKRQQEEELVSSPSGSLDPLLVKFCSISDSLSLVVICFHILLFSENGF